MAKTAVLAGWRIQDEADHLALGVPAGQGDDRGSVGLWPGLPGLAGAVPGPLVQLSQHHVGPVDLVTSAADVLADRPAGGAPADAVFHQPGGLRLVRVGSRTCVDAQLCLDRLADRSGLGAADQALGEDRCLRPGSQPDSQPPGGEVIDAAALAVSGGGQMVVGLGGLQAPPELRALRAIDQHVSTYITRARLSQAAASRTIQSALDQWYRLGWDGAGAGDVSPRLSPARGAPDAVPRSGAALI